MRRASGGGSADCAGGELLFSARNTLEPVALVEDTISTTKPDPKLHAFGLANGKAILDKYHGFHAMEYADGWFQFAGEMPVLQDPGKGC